MTDFEDRASCWANGVLLRQSILDTGETLDHLQTHVLMMSDPTAPPASQDMRTKLMVTVDSFAGEVATLSERLKMAKKCGADVDRQGGYRFVQKEFFIGDPKVFDFSHARAVLDDLRLSLQMAAVGKERAP